MNAEINRLRKERNAVILAHNYTRGEVQDIADFTGDSLELARKAATVEADVTVCTRRTRRRRFFRSRICWSAHGDLVWR